MTNPVAVDNLLGFWVPFIQNYNRSVPILLLGNKLDLVLKNEDKFVKQRIRRVANQIFKKSNVGFSSELIGSATGTLHRMLSDQKHFHSICL